MELKEKRGKEIIRIGYFDTGERIVMDFGNLERAYLDHEYLGDHSENWVVVEGALTGEEITRTTHDIFPRLIGRSEMDNQELDFKSAFYKNCKRRRKEVQKICDSCPFKNWIIERERMRDD